MYDFAVYCFSFRQARTNTQYIGNNIYIARVTNGWHLFQNVQIAQLRAESTGWGFRQHSVGVCALKSWAASRAHAVFLHTLLHHLSTTTSSSYITPQQPQTELTSHSNNYKQQWRHNHAPVKQLKILVNKVNSCNARAHTHTLEYTHT